MKYLLQIFRPSSPGSNVGSWENTNWGSDDLQKVMDTADRVAESAHNKMGITRVRVVEVLKELEVKSAL